jgi:ribosomal-protein-alanine N-acetyltransferase
MAVKKNEVFPGETGEFLRERQFRDVVLREMIHTDIPQIMAIEESSFPTPWTYGIFTRELELDFSHNYVFDLHGEVIAYTCTWLIEGEVHIMNIAVKREYRRRGLGMALLGETLRRACGMRAKFVFLEVRESNERALSLYRRLGFDIVHVRKGYYTDTQEDAFIMARWLSPIE